MVHAVHTPSLRVAIGGSRNMRGSHCYVRPRPPLMGHFEKEERIKKEERERERERHCDIFRSITGLQTVLLHS